MGYQTINAIKQRMPLHWMLKFHRAKRIEAGHYRAGKKKEEKKDYWKISLCHVAAQSKTDHAIRSGACRGSTTRTSSANGCAVVVCPQN